MTQDEAYTYRKDVQVMKNQTLKKLLSGSLAVSVALTSSSAWEMDYVNAESNSKIRTAATNMEETETGVFHVTMDDTGRLNASSENAADENTPFSWDNASVYFALTDRFYNGDKSNDHSYGRSVGEVDADSYADRVGTFHGGDLKGMTQKLEEGYFDDLGTNAIWITAPYEQIHGALCGNGFKHYSYHGYYVLDYTEVDQNMGTEKELETFINTAHEHGIRVIFDIVMNHAGYADAVTINEYFGDGTSALSSNWKDVYYKTNASQYQWYNDYYEIAKEKGKDGMLVQNSDDWVSKWWGPSWIRAMGERFKGYEGKEADGIETCVSGLPDFKTEGTSDPGIPPILKTKWNREKTYDAKIAMTEESLKAGGLSKNVTGYISAWLSNWVRKYGVDGFRCDTAKHVRTSEWGVLKKACVQALKDWRKANPSKPGAKWTDDFWMTGEAWGHGVAKDDYYTTGGFDSMINFSYKGNEKNSGSGLEGVFSDYARQLNSDPSFNALSFISSHDSGLAQASANSGIALLLTPGGVQTYYGEETGRPVVAGPDYEPARGNMNWDSIDKKIQNVWQKVGRFRRNHISVGAGKHEKLSESPYTFSRTYSGTVQGADYEDSVVVALPGSAGTYDVSVKGVFEDGTALTDEFSGETYTVDGGSVSVTCDENGVILLGAGGVAKASVGATASQSFTSDTLKITLKASKAKEAYYTLNGGKKVSFKTGDTITIGEGDAFDTTYTLVVGGTSEEGDAIKEKTFTYTKVDTPAYTFYIRTKASDYSFTPNIYLYDNGKALANMTWPGVPMTKEGEYYVYSSSDFSKANVIINDGGTWQDPAKDVDMVCTGCMEYTYKSTKLTAISLTKATTKPTVTKTPATAAPATEKPSTKVTATPKAATSKPTVTESPKTDVPSSGITIGSNIVSASSPQEVGKSLTLRASAKGGSGSYKYKFYIENLSTHEVEMYKDWTHVRVATWVPKKAGKYEIIVSARDEQSKDIATHTQKYVIAKKIKVSKFNISKKGKKLKISLKTNGKFLYKIVAVSSKKKKTVLSKYTDKTTISCKIKTAGTYKIYLYVKDKSSGYVKKIKYKKQLIVK